MVYYSYKDTRLSVFRPAPSHNLNPCWSWPQADHGSSHSLSTYTQHWVSQTRGGEGMLPEQGDQPVSKSANPHLPGHQPTSSCWKSFPFAKYRHTGFHSTALSKPLSRFLRACRGKDRFREFLGENKEALSTQTATICRNFFWPCQCQARGKYNNTWEMPSPSPADHPSAQEIHPPE